MAVSNLTLTEFMALTESARITWWYGATTAQIKTIQNAAGGQGAGLTIPMHAAEDGANARLHAEILASNEANTRTLVAAYELVKAGG